MVMFITILKYNAVDTLCMDFRGSPMIAAHNETQACQKSVSAAHSYSKMVNDQQKSQFSWKTYSST